MTTRALVREALTSARAARIPSILTLLVVAAMCLAALLTVGRSAAAAREVADQMEQSGARRLTVTDVGGAGFITAQAVSQVRSMNTVQRVVAVSSAIDVTNLPVGSAGPSIPLWQVLGPISDAVTLVRGRLPQAGEALVSCSAAPTIGFEAPVGTLLDPATAQGLGVVGCYRAEAPFADLAAGAITPAGPQTVANQLRVVIDAVTSSDATTSAVLAVLAPPELQSAQVDSPSDLARTAQQLNAQMAGYGRSLLGGIMLVGGFFIAVVVLADTLVHQRDLGRRRTLGITRGGLVALVAARTFVPALAGAVLGGLGGVAAGIAQGIGVPLEFAAAVCVLALLAAVAATVPPAVHAARRDPVEVMRTA